MNKIVKLGYDYLSYKVSYLLSLSLLIELYKYIFLIFLLYLLIYSLDFYPLYCDCGSDIPYIDNTNKDLEEYKLLSPWLKFKRNLSWTKVKVKYGKWIDNYKICRDFNKAMKHINFICDIDKNK